MTNFSGKPVSINYIRNYKKKFNTVDESPDKLYEKEQFMDLWSAIKSGKRKRFPKGIWQHHENRMLAVECCIEEKKREHRTLIYKIKNKEIELTTSPIFTYPDLEYFVDKHLRGVLHAKSKNEKRSFLKKSVFEAYSQYNLFNPDSENYDPKALLMHLSFTRATTRRTDERVLEYLLSEITELSIIAGVEGSISEYILKNKYLLPTLGSNIGKNINVGYGMQFRKDVLLFGQELENRQGKRESVWSVERVLSESKVFFEQYGHISKLLLEKNKRADLANAISRIGIQEGRGFTVLKNRLVSNNIKP
jgi:hypothetical protein